MREMLAGPRIYAGGTRDTERVIAKPTRAAAFGRAFCIGGAAIGFAGLVAWIAGVPELTAIVAAQPLMQPNTALCLTLLGFAGALRLRKYAPSAVSILMALAVLSIGTATLAEYVLGVDLHIDALLQAVLIDREPAGPYPLRPSLLTAFALVLLSTAILMFDIRASARVRPAECFLFLALLTAVTALIGVAYGAGPLYRFSVAPMTSVAIATASALLLISIGLLLARPDVGVMRIVTSPDPGGIMLRRLMLPVLLATLLIGPVVTHLLLALGLRDFPLLAATLTIAIAAASLLLLASATRPLDRAHRILEASRARIRDLFEYAPEGIFVADAAGRFTDVNGAGCRMLGFSREQICGKTVFEFIAAEGRERLEREKEEMLKGRTIVSEWMLRRSDGTWLPAEVSARILADGRWQGFVRDVSERKRAEEQIRQSRERLDLALRGADLGTWDWNVQTGEVTFNARWAEMRGFQLEEVVPHVSSWEAGVHPDDWPRVQRVLQEHLDGKTSEYETEQRVRTRSGEWLWILDRGKVFTRDDSGRPIRMAGVERDITDQKRLEEQLRLSLAQASGILAISADAIISIDENECVTLFNNGAEKIFGCRREDALGGSLERWIPERFRAAHRRYAEEFGRGREEARRMAGQRATIFARRNDGSEFPVDAAISKLDVGGRRVLTVALRDITAQKRIEREKRLIADFASALSASLDYDETLRNIVQAAVRELADICVVEISEEGGRSPRVQVAHRNALGRAAIEALHRRSFDVQRTPEPLVSSEITTQYLESIAADASELEALRELNLSSLIVLPLTGHERVLGSMVLLGTHVSPAFDGKDLALAEEVARRAATAVENARLYRAALRATQARDEVLSIAAHDLRNPLNTIALEAATLRRLGGESDPQTSDIVATICRASDRMSRLVDDLLDLSLIETGHLSLELARVSTRQLIEDCVEQQEALATAASLDISAEAQSDVPEIWADRDRAMQVLENLVGNAIKFTAPGGRIIVGAGRRDDEIRIWVSNTGAGIPAEHLPHLFDRFWRARQTKRSGAGLGLAIVKGIVEAHGGRVWAQSTPGQGSTFVLTIPMA